MNPKSLETCLYDALTEFGAMEFPVYELTPLELLYPVYPPTLKPPALVVLFLLLVADPWQEVVVLSIIVQAAATESVASTLHVY